MLGLQSPQYGAPPHVLMGNPQRQGPGTVAGLNPSAQPFLPQGQAYAQVTDSLMTHLPSSAAWTDLQGYEAYGAELKDSCTA